MRSLAVLAVLAGIPLIAARDTRAMQYEVFVNVETEQDLYELRNEEQIDDRSFEALRTLMNHPVDLNSASRARVLSLPNIDRRAVDLILAYRARTGTLSSLQDLLGAGILTDDLAHSLRPFVVFHDAGGSSSERARALLRLQTRFTGRYDRYPPATALQARLSTARDVHLGLAASLQRNQIGQARYDRSRNALSASPPRTRLLVPKAFVLWRGERWKLVAGTYRVGFGQSLVFDSTAQTSPHGFVGDDEMRRPSELVRRCAERAAELAIPPCRDGGRTRITPDYDWTERLTGLAVGYRSHERSGRWSETHAWASYQVHGASQYELRFRAQCPDPRRDADEACGPPSVFVRRKSALGATSQWTSTRLPRMYAETLGGANLSYFWNARSHLGITGYGAKLRWMLPGVALGLQESARRPFGGPFAALGLNLAYGQSKHDLQLELARSFDGQSRTRGGWAAIARSLSTLPTGQIDLSARYYASRYANPHARPRSAADELDGLRARDEAGLSMRARFELGDHWTLRSSAELWRELSTEALKSKLRLRADFEPSARWAGSVSTVQGMGEGRHSVTAAARVISRPSGRLRVSMQLQYAASRSRPSDPRFAGTLGAIASLAARPKDHTRLTMRVRYDRLTHAYAKSPDKQLLWAYLSTAFSLPRGNGLRLRYDFRLSVGGPASGSRRRPNPENWFALEYLWRSP